MWTRDIKVAEMPFLKNIFFADMISLLCGEDKSNKTCPHQVNTSLLIFTTADMLTWQPYKVCAAKLLTPHKAEESIKNDLL